MLDYKNQRPMRRNRQKVSLLYNDSRVRTVEVHLQQHTRAYSPIRKIEQSNCLMKTERQENSSQNLDRQVDTTLSTLLSKIKKQTSVAKQKLERKPDTILTSKVINGSAVQTSNSGLHYQSRISNKHNSSVKLNHTRRSIFEAKKSTFSSRVADKVAPIQIKMKPGNNQSIVRYTTIESIMEYPPDLKCPSTQPTPQPVMEPSPLQFQGQQWFSSLVKFCR